MGAIGNVFARRRDPAELQQPAVEQRIRPLIAMEQFESGLD